MSVSYVTTQPMTLDQAIHRLKEVGCTVGLDGCRCCCAVVKDPDGNHFHLTDEFESSPAMSFDLLSNDLTIGVTKIRDGTTRVMGECYGVNDATRIAAVLDMVSEYEGEYHEIVGIADPDEAGDEV